LATKIYLVAAARPNFMKVAPLWHAFAELPELFAPVLIHTGQHYDKNMSDVFLQDLGLPAPHVHLGVGAGTHAEQTGGVMIEFEKVCLAERPDLVLVVGDVNSTLAAAITAKKLWIPVGHVEAGLRSRDWEMPEEINRIVTDSISDLLFTPSPDADENLRHEGVPAAKIHRVGNIMIDTLVHSIEKARDRAVFERFGLAPGSYCLVTLHRPANVDDPASLDRLFAGMDELEIPIVFPVHPRTRKVMETAGLADRYGGEGSRLHLTEPLGYYDFLNLTMHARFVLTDSGGIQEETTFLGVPCLTLRTTTERPITITQGTNELVTLDDLPDQAARIVKGEGKQGSVPDLWDGRTAGRIVAVLREYFGPAQGV